MNPKTFDLYPKLTNLKEDELDFSLFSAVAIPVLAADELRVVETKFIKSLTELSEIDLNSEIKKWPDFAAKAGEIIEIATGKNITEQKQADLNRIKWSELNPSNALKAVRGNGSRQMAVFSDPNCGYCKRLEKSLQQLDNVTIYTYLIPILSPDSAQKSKQIWCSADPQKAYIDWMINGVAPSGKSDCATPLDKNMAFAKTYGITGTPTIFFTDGSRFPGAVQITDIEKKFSSLK